jgi:hypothetical protein
MQIHLTEAQRRRLDARGRRTGAPLARMVREALDADLADELVDADEASTEPFGTLPSLVLPSRDGSELPGLAPRP